MKRINLLLDEELYEWLTQQAEKNQRTTTEMTRIILQMRQKQLKTWADTWHKRVSNPMGAYRERERIRLLKQREREEKRRIK